jgi:hypothetical protein
MSDDDLFVIKLAVATLIVPTITYFAIRQTRRGPRPLAARVMSWLCLWIGQCAVPMGFIVVAMGWWGYQWWDHGHVAVALVYGAGMAALAGLLFALSLRVFRIGTLALGQATEDAIAATARRMLPWCIAAMLLAIGFWYVLLSDHLPIPGRWAGLVYFLLCILPVTTSAFLVTLIAFVMRHPPWR